jgi:hypothetical protein
VGARTLRACGLPIVISTRYLAVLFRVLVALVLILGPGVSADAQDTRATQLLGISLDDSESPDGIAVEIVAIQRTAESQDRELDLPVGPPLRVNFTLRQSSGRMPLPQGGAGPSLVRCSSAPPTGPPLT